MNHFTFLLTTVYIPYTHIYFYIYTFCIHHNTIPLMENGKLIFSPSQHDYCGSTDGLRGHQEFQTFLHKVLSGFILM